MPAKLKPWECQECGKRFSAKGAEKAMSVGCPKCGGVDIDLHVEGAIPQNPEWGHRLHAAEETE